MKRLALICGVLLAGALRLTAQDAAAVTEILNKDTATLTDFSYLVASQLGMECTPFEAYVYCDRFGQFPFGKDAETPVTVKMISHFLMANYGLSGGIMWTATRSGRYAWKEMRSNGFWKAGTDPNMTLSGRDLVRTMSRFAARWPDALLRDPPVGEASADYRAAILSPKGDSL